MTKKKPKTTKQEYKKIPVSQVVFVNLDDEVASVFDQIQKKTGKHIYIVAPNRAVIFQSTINLKILKRKAKDLNKTIAIVTTDKNGQYHAKQSKLEVYSDIQEVTGTRKVDPKPVPKPNKIEITEHSTSPKPQEQEKEKEPKVVSGLKEKANQKVEDLKNNFNKSKQDTKNTLKKQFYKVFPSLENNHQKFLVNRPNKGLLITLGSFSLILLVFVAYISLPKAIINVTPNFLPVEQTVNITLADEEKNNDWLRTTTNKAVPIYKLSPGVIEKTITFTPTGFDASGQNSQGEIIIYNESNRDWPLVPFTRFSTDTGIVVRSQRFINLPPGSPENPSSATVQVVADSFDFNNIPIGDRGNLPAETKLKIPNLRESSQSQVYGVVKYGLTGGVTSKDRIVNEKDIVSSQEFAIEELKKSFDQQLTSYINKYNKDHSLNLQLFNFSETFEFTDFEVTDTQKLLGQKMPSFDVTARTNLSAFAYDKDKFDDILVKQIQRNKSPDKELSKIDTDSIQTRILKPNLQEGFIEVTATITGIESYQLDDQTVAGGALHDKIITNVAGLDTKDAEKFIQVLPEVDKVEIETWPFWAPTLPSKAENIRLKVHDQKIPTN